MVAFWKADVTDAAATGTVIDDGAPRFGGLRVLANDAGISGSPKPTDQVAEPEAEEVQL